MDAANLASLKELVRKPEFMAEMKEVFFEAMMAGYAAEEKPKKSEIPGLPRSKMPKPFVKGPWTVIDFWFTTLLSDSSGGTTIILYEGQPVWMMQYFGLYCEAAIPCLKGALRAAYQEGKFFGGRGPEYWRYKPSWPVYRNKPYDFSSTFDVFHGVETVETSSGTPIGVHRYQGGLML